MSLLGEVFRLSGVVSINTSEAVRSIEEISKKAEGLASRIGSAMTSAGESMTKMGKSLAPVSTGLTTIGTLAVKTAADFEDSMLKVQALSGATAEQYQQLSNKARDLGASTAWSATQVADAMGYMALAGFDTEEILASVGSMLNLASASGEDLATVTDILTDSMTAFGDGAEDAARYADVLATTQAKSNTTVGMLGEAFKYVAPLAGSYGYALEDVSTALGVMANAGVKGSMAGTSLSSVITRLGNNTNGARDAITALGISFYNSDGTARNLSDVLKDMADKTANMTVEEKAHFASVVAGQEAQKGLLAILNQGSEAYAELENAIKDSDDAAGQMAETMESGLGGAIRSLKSALEAVSITLGNTLAPYIKSAADKIKELCDWFQNLSPAAQDIIVKAGMLVAALSPVLIVGGQVISSIGNMITVGATLTTKITGLISGFGGLSGVLGALTSPIGIVVAAIGGLIAIFVTLYNTNENFKKTVQTAWNQIKTSLSGVIEAIKGLISAFTETAQAIWDNWGNSIVAIATTAFNLISNGIQTALNVIKGIINTVTALIKGDWTGVFNSLASITSSIFNGMKNTIQTILNGAFSIVSNVLASIYNAFVSKFNAVADFVHNVIEKIKGFFNFSWSLPKLKLPHLKIDGEFSLFPPSVPSFSIDWYKKAMDQPYMFTSPTLFDMNPMTGTARGAGEAGPEVMIGKETMLTMIQEAVARENSGVSTFMERIYNLLTEYIPNMASRQLVLDTGAMVGELASPMNDALGSLYAKQKRGV